MNSDSRIVVVSNRLPITIEKKEGTTTVRPSSGGLATALRAALSEREAVWVGWNGTVSNGTSIELSDAPDNSSLHLAQVPLSEEQFNKFYFGFSNEIIWPLFHDLQSRCNFDPSYWSSYLEVNRNYAEAVAQIARPTDKVWVHDYHLAFVGHFLRQMGITNRVGFFQHIPFPSPDIFSKLPWRREYLQSILSYDLVGFQTGCDLRNFLYCTRALLGRRVSISRREPFTIFANRSTTALALPIGIHYDEFSMQASTESVREAAAELRRVHMNRRILLGVDRLDYTKGIPERLKAYEMLLERHPEWRGKVVLVQIVVPSREDIPRYRDLRQEIQQLVAHINGRFSDQGWVPIHYLHRHIPREQLLAYYRSADAAIVTPLKDGMNLVAKEYCAAQVDLNGVLVLSEFAGASHQLGKSAMLVNPYAIEATAESVHRTLKMSAASRRERMQQLRLQVKSGDVHRWTESFLTALTEQPPESVSSSAPPTGERVNALGFTA